MLNIHFTNDELHYFAQFKYCLPKYSLFRYPKLDIVLCTDQQKNYLSTIADQKFATNNLKLLTTVVNCFLTRGEYRQIH